MMTFTPTQKELFNKNIESLSNILLKESLKEIQSSRFEPTLGKDNLDINLKDTNDNTFLYENVIDELNSILNTYNDKYLLYPVLYLHDFGNGILFKALLQNKNHQHIVVFEKDIEIVWIMFHILDFSSELQSARLMVLQTSSLDIEFFSNFCSSKPLFQFSRIYFLKLMSHYYERFHGDILGLNKKLAENFKNSIVSCGNDPLDALQGIEQFVYNLPQMITHPSYRELLSKRKNLSDTAIIVSTGPSLTKQLSLLKKYASKATTFCAGSSYPILAKHGIKPDYVCMLERTEITAEFFNHDFGEFDNGICSIVKSIVHPNVINYLTKKIDNFTIVSTYASFTRYSKLDYSGYFNMGFSVTHMACYLSLHLNHKDIIFIGQDLTYAENDNSYPNDYQNSANYESQTYEYILTKAYGGKEKTKAHHVWLMLKRDLEQDVQEIQKYLDTRVYNHIEGGARIKETIEEPFLWAYENLPDKDLNKSFEKLEPLSLNKQNEFLLEAYYKVYQSIKHCGDFSDNFIKIYDKIKNSFMSLQNFQKNEIFIQEIIQDIDKTKTQIDELCNTQKNLIQTLGPLLTQFELNLVRIYVLNPKAKEDAFNKSILWIKEHSEFMELAYGHIKAQGNALIENILPLEGKLRERKLDKWTERVRR